MLVVAEFPFPSLKEYHQFDESNLSDDFQTNIQKQIAEYIRDHTDLNENTEIRLPTWENDEKTMKKTALYAIEPQLVEHFLHY